MQELAKILRGEVVASFSPHGQCAGSCMDGKGEEVIVYVHLKHTCCVFPPVTHVIAPCNSLGCCARTLKALCGIAMGKWILSFDCEYISKIKILSPRTSLCVGISY